MTSTDIQTDIVIIGGGLIGLSLANALAPFGMRITIIESFDPSNMQKDSFDGRVSAIAYGSRNMFEVMGVWNSMVREAGEILDIRITDSNALSFLHYDHQDVGDEPMGHIIENRHLRRALFEGIDKHQNIRLLAPATYAKIHYDSHSVEVTLDDGRTIRAKLLVAADGKKSPLRQQAGISTTQLNYNQTGIVCTVKHAKHHQHTAIERFLPAGPFAILPMQGGHHSSLVWTEKSALAPIFMEMDEVHFTEEVSKRFGNYLGKLELVGQRWSYPLSLTFADEYVRQRMCLIGDAAHGIHPIAGQGFNLGLRDVAVLAELIVDTKRLGLDIGGTSVLERYQRIRRIDNLQMIAVTDSLNRLFSNNVFPIKLARRFGLTAVNVLPPLKRTFMRHAMGVAGDAPKLVRGERL